MNPIQTPSGSSPMTSHASILALRELVERVGSQVDSAHREIGETRAILKDAVERLMPAFTAMRNVEFAVEALDARATDIVRSSHATRARGPAFSALQFQDISDQLLAHAQGRLASLRAQVTEIAAVMGPEPSGYTKVDALMQMVACANEKLAMLDVSLVKPVGKAHLGTGDMEFF